MTETDVWIEKTETLIRGSQEETPGAMADRTPRIKDIISGMILLAARGGNPMPLTMLHSVLHEMKSRESILSGIRFSLTGAVCYSRDIDQAVNRLAESGFLEIVDGSVFVMERAHEFGDYLSGYLTNSQIQAVRSASLRFHERLRRDAGDPRNRG
jgi:hypothetical protein